MILIYALDEKKFMLLLRWNIRRKDFLIVWIILSNKPLLYLVISIILIFIKDKWIRNIGRFC